MSKNNDVLCADLAAYYQNCGCHDHHHHHEPHCPPGFFWAPAPPPPVPPEYPRPEKEKCDCDCCKKDTESEIEVKKSSTEGQICKLSKKAAALNRLLTNMESKKKDVIIKIGDTSFNFGNIDSEFAGWEDGEEKSYAATVKRIIEHQRALVMTEIKELADALDDEVTESTGIEGAITGG